MVRLAIPIVLAAVCAVAPATAEDFTTLDLAVSGRIVASPCRFASTSTSNVDFGRVMLADFREGETVGTPQAVTLRFEGCRLSPADSTGTGIIDDSIDFGTVRVSLHDVGGYGDAASEGLVSSRGAVVRLTTVRVERLSGKTARLRLKSRTLTSAPTTRRLKRST